MIVGPGDRRYSALRSTYTKRGTPAGIALPRTATEVAGALAHAREHGLAVAVRSGGHGLAGTSTNDGGLVVDLSAMDEVTVLDRDAGLVRVGAGARWADVAAVLGRHGLAISAGDHGNVGVGGLVTGGGIGWLVRSYGLTIDHVRAADVVLADGRLARADAEHDPELLWTVRGAGAGAGIVTAFEITAARVRDVGMGQFVFAADRDGGVLRRWASTVEGAPRELSTAVTVFRAGGSAVVQVTAVVADGNAGRVRKILQPMRELGPLLDSRVDVVPYPALVSPAHKHPNVGQQPVTLTNGLFTRLPAEAVMGLVHSGRSLVQLRSVGGAVNDVAADATAYAHRHQNVLVLASVFPPEGRAALESQWRGLAGSADGAYVNFESARDRSAFARAYPGRTGARVAAAWDRYDPGGLLRPGTFGPG
ncbi:FAD-binding oxidoreductase [Dactylosporangium sp. CS-033363]|uniref:FAD-binding oxidoreductase n=1 Tax=Dactylosporangium sp. CS-033363 TaxID=3239935 RepID=UPI003D8FAA27